MRKFILTIAFILLSFESIYSQETDSSNQDKSKASQFIYQINLGSAYSFYFPLINTTIDLMDSGSLIRFPLNLNFMFGKKISESLAWTIYLSTDMDIFTASPDNLQLYTMALTGGFQYIPFKTGLTLGIDAGFSVLIPNTNLSYIGSTEPGSTISLDLGYTFETLIFSRLGIIPGIEFKFIHSEMFRGAVNKISGYISLAIR